MRSVPRFSEKSTLKIKVLTMMLLILVASVWFALHSQPVRHVAPDLIVMAHEVEARTILVNVARLRGNSYTLVMEV